MLDFVNVGVAGAGVFGSYHASKFVGRPRTALKSIFDIDENRARQLAQRFDVGAETDFDAFLANVDAVIIATPAVTHAALAMKAINAGKHVLVEKPVATDRKSAAQLVAQARAKNVIFQAGHQERYVVSAAGLFSLSGKLVAIECVRKTSATGRCEDVSVVYDLMVHDFDIVSQLTNSDIASVAAQGNRNEVIAAAKLGCGVSAVFRASRCSHDSERSIKLVCQDGEILFDFNQRKVVRNTRNEPLEPLSPVTGAMTDPLGYGAGQFVDAIISGVNPAVNGEHGRIAVQWAEQVSDALQEKRLESESEQERMRA